MSSALYSSLRGEEVSLFEAHTELGGCASFFRRGKFTFDVGATTLSGLLPHKPLGKLCSLLGASPEVYKMDPGMVIHLSSGKVITYHQELEAWIKELESHFPKLKHRKFWTKIFKLSDLGWKILGEFSHYAPTLGDILRILSRPMYWSLFPSVLVSTEMMLKHFELFNEEYLELINGILIISAQAHAPEVPFLVGAMSLSYPSETYAPVGGMKGFVHFFETELVKRKVKIQKKTPFKNLSIEGNYKLHFEQKNESAERVILNLPLWNVPPMLPSEIANHLSHQASKKPGYWGAFTLYFGMEGKIKELYQQVHLNHPLCKNYFLSLSHPDDLTRAPEGYQAVTISTHVEAKAWFGLNESDYQEKKMELKNLIMNDFMKRFQVSDLKVVTAGTPMSFKHYTGREFGFVGGIPWLYGQNPLSLLRGKIDQQELYLVGDSIFPGQGIVGVIEGARILDQTMREV